MLELLVVIAIIGVITAVGLSVISYARLKARDAKRLGDFNALSQALEMYLSTNGAYPVWSTGGCTSDGSGTNNPLATALVPTYIGSLPKDPKLNQYCYFYKTDSTGSQYKLAAYLEGDSAKSANDGGTASNYYEKFAYAGLQTSGGGLSVTNSDLGKVMTNQQNLGDASIVGYWKFDEGSGTTVNDSSAYLNIGTISPGTSSAYRQTSGCISGNCLSFNGVNVYIDFSNNSVFDLTTSATMETWLYYTSASNWQDPFSKGYDSTYAFKGFNGDLIWRLQLQNGGDTYRNFAGPLSGSTWYHLVGTYDGQTLTSYKNGIAAGTTSVSRDTIKTSNRHVMMGSGDYDGNGTPYPGEYFNGLMDEARIYGRVLSSCEVCKRCRLFKDETLCNSCCANICAPAGQTCP